MFKKITLCVLFIFTPLISMEQYRDIQCHQDEWTAITAYADTETKNTLAKVCRTLYAISSKNNLNLYRCNLLNLSTSQKKYALRYTLYKRQPDIVNHLQVLGADITVPFLKRPLRHIQLYNDPLTLQTKTNNRDSFYQLPQYLVAAYCGDIDYLKTYYEAEDVSSFDTKTGISSLQLAIRNGHIATVGLLLTHKSIAKVINTSNKNYERPLYLAASYGHYGICSLLFNHPQLDLSLYNNNDPEAPPIHIACKEGYKHIVEFFIKHKPEWLDVCFQECRPLHLASCFGHHEIVQLLCEKGADKNPPECAPLFIATDQNKPQVVKVLLCYPDVLINNKTPDGTVLFYASKLNRIEIVQLLLSRKDVDPTIDLDGDKPLHIAAKKGNTEIVRLLVEHSPSLINIANKDGNTALHLAVLEQKLHTIDFLLNVENILVNSVNQANKHTPLDCAISTSSSQVKELLKQLGITSTNQEIIDLLKKHNAKTYQEVCDSKV